MNVKEAARLLGVSAGKVYALAAPTGPIPCTRIGKRIIFDQSDILEYQASCRFTEIKSAVASCSTSPARLNADEADHEYWVTGEQAIDYFARKPPATPKGGAV